MRYLSNATLLDEDMVDISDWTDDDSGSGVSSQVTYDSKSTMKLLTVATGGIARRKIDVGSFGARVVASASIYCSAIGTRVNVDGHYLYFYNGSYLCNICLATDGCFVMNAATAWIEAGTNVVSVGVWQEWTFDINWTSKKVDVYCNNVLQGSQLDCAYGTSAIPNGTVILVQRDVTTADRLSYVDWIKVGDNFQKLGGLFAFHG